MWEGEKAGLCRINVFMESRSRSAFVVDTIKMKAEALSGKILYFLLAWHLIEQWITLVSIPTTRAACFKNNTHTPHHTTHIHEQTYTTHRCRSCCYLLVQCSEFRIRSSDIQHEIAFKEMGVYFFILVCVLKSHHKLCAFTIGMVKLLQERSCCRCDNILLISFL